MLFFLICLVPLLIPIVFKAFYPSKVTNAEMVGCSVSSVLMAAIIYYSSLYSEMADEQILNGMVTGKSSQIVSCRHSYRCHCTTIYSGTGKNRTSRRSCKTCYEHGFDKQWVVKTTLGNYHINTIDRQGLIEPPFYTGVYVKQPVAKSEQYVNYVKGNSQSLFNVNKYTDLKSVPEYDTTISNYFYHNHVTDMGTRLATGYNDAISSYLSVNGFKKQVNVKLVFTFADYEYSEKLKAKWLNGKKNDVVIVFGIDKTTKTKRYVHAFGWSNNEMVFIKLRDDLMANPSLNVKEDVSSIAKNIDQYFQRKSMKDFEYLKGTIEPSSATIILSLLLGIIISISTSIFAVRNDIM